MFLIRTDQIVNNRDNFNKPKPEKNVKNASMEKQF